MADSKWFDKITIDVKSLDVQLLKPDPNFKLFLCGNISLQRGSRCVEAAWLPAVSDYEGADDKRIVFYMNGHGYDRVASMSCAVGWLLQHADKKDKNRDQSLALNIVQAEEPFELKGMSGKVLSMRLMRTWFEVSVHPSIILTAQL